VPFFVRHGVFSQNRIQRVQNTTLVCEIRAVRAITLLQTLLAADIRRQPPGERHKVIDVPPFTSSKPGHFRRDRIEKMISMHGKKRGVLNCLVRL